MMKSMCCNCALHKIALILLIVGGLNWGLVGAFEYNLVEVLLGQWEVVMRVVYVLVGVSAILTLLAPMCNKMKMGK